MDIDLCPTCGASWECDCRPDLRVIEKYIDDPFGPPIAKVVPIRKTDKDFALYLRQIATAIEVGDYPATAIYAVVMVGDVRHPFFNGFEDWAEIAYAANAFIEERDRRDDARRGSEIKSPERYAADRRNAKRTQARKYVDDLAGLPHVCACNERFGTERGLGQHISYFNSDRAQDWQRQNEHAPAPEDKEMDKAREQLALFSDEPLHLVTEPPEAE